MPVTWLVLANTTSRYPEAAAANWSQRIATVQAQGMAAVAEMVATSNPELRRWLLTEGFRNTVTPQYLAYQCSTNCKSDNGCFKNLNPLHKIYF